MSTEAVPANPAKPLTAVSAPSSILAPTLVGLGAAVLLRVSDSAGRLGGVRAVLAKRVALRDECRGEVVPSREITGGFSAKQAGSLPSLIGVIEAADGAGLK